MPCTIPNKPRKARLCDLTTPFFVLAMFLYTISTTNASALEPPTNIRLDGATLSWDEVPGASEITLMVRYLLALF